MKVFAEYGVFEGDEYRRKTLLFFGDKGSTELIGSAVLANPGSAKSHKNADIQPVDDFYATNFPDEEIHEIEWEWRKYDSDPTMRLLKKVFDGSYKEGRRVELNGVIQLFNCFYIKDPHLKNAVTKFPVSKFKFTDEDRFFLNKPVFFGWGTTDELIQEKGEEIFNRYKTKQTGVYYNPDYSKNDFYHPISISCENKANESLQKWLDTFYHWVNENESD